MGRNATQAGPHPVDRHVGRRVAAKRIELGYNQTDLGKALGLTFQQIQKYEKGANRISSSKLWDMSRFFGVDVAWFFEGLEDAPIGDQDPAPETNYPVTRHTVEIARLAPQLSPSRQRLALDLIREFAERPAETGAPSDAGS